VWWPRLRWVTVSVSVNQLRRSLSVGQVVVIVAAVPEAKTKMRQKSLNRLNEHHRALYDIIIERETVEPQILHTEYRDRVEELKSERILRNYLRKLRQYNLIKAEGQTRGRTYRAA
jgi:Cdc6-like AAA superfamily ATPase